MSDKTLSPSQANRRLVVGAMASAAAALAAPAIVRAQPNVLRIGHLTPRTGFLGPMGEYAVMGATLAMEEVNAAGGALGRPFEILFEDSVNPQTASTKAQRMVERDKVDFLVGEISSASGLAISQVATRAQKMFMQTGCNSDELRGKNCSRYMFHLEANNSMYVRTIGREMLRQNMVKGKRWMAFTADYAFGHDLFEKTKRFMDENGAIFISNDMVPTDATEFSSLILKVRQQRPDLVMSNLAGNSTTNFMKQYKEFNLPIPLAGADLNAVSIWGAGEGSTRSMPLRPRHSPNASPSAGAVRPTTRPWPTTWRSRSWHVPFRRPSRSTRKSSSPTWRAASSSMCCVPAKATSVPGTTSSCSRCTPSSPWPARRAASGM